MLLYNKSATSKPPRPSPRHEPSPNTLSTLTLISAPQATMGNDGGSIPKRRELVKEAAKALTAAQIKEAQNEKQEYGWSTDPLTRKPLAEPIVSDAAGVLYNKDSIIEYLLKDDADVEKAEMRKTGGINGTVEGGFAELGTFGHRIKGLKDVVEIKFEVTEEKGEKWVCPITGTLLGPNAKAVYIVPCGHAFAGSVVKEVAGSVCLTVCFLIPHTLFNTSQPAKRRFEQNTANMRE